MYEFLKIQKFVRMIWAPVLFYSNKKTSKRYLRIFKIKKFVKYDLGSKFK